MHFKIIKIWTQTRRNGILLWILNTIRFHTVFMYQKAFRSGLSNPTKRRVSSKLLSDINTSRSCITDNKSLPGFKSGRRSVGGQRNRCAGKVSDREKQDGVWMLPFFSSCQSPHWSVNIHPSLPHPSVLSCTLPSRCLSIRQTSVFPCSHRVGCVVEAGSHACTEQLDRSTPTCNWSVISNFHTLKSHYWLVLISTASLSHTHTHKHTHRYCTSIFVRTFHRRDAFPTS